jgi:hypothetical protein
MYFHSVTLASRVHPVPDGQIFDAIAASFQTCSHRACVTHLLRIRCGRRLRLLLSGLLPPFVSSPKPTRQAAHRRSSGGSGSDCPVLIVKVPIRPGRASLAGDFLDEKTPLASSSGP